jgi:hypothetical protein
MSFESRPAAFDTAVCGNGSLLTQTIVSPVLTVSAGGTNCTASMVTVCVTGGGTSAAAERCPLQESRDSAAAAAARELLIT